LAQIETGGSMLLRRRSALLLVAMGFIASLALSGTVSQRAWLAGEHVTPEQVALHNLYESLGIHDHHSHAPAAPGDESDPDAILAAIAAMPGPAFTLAVPSGLPDPGAAPMTTRGQRLHGDLPIETLEYVTVPNEPRPAQPAFLTADPPPRRAA
jgi:hypothetical protein